MAEGPQVGARPRRGPGARALDLRRDPVPAEPARPARSNVMESAPVRIERCIPHDPGLRSVLIDVAHEEPSVVQALDGFRPEAPAEQGSVSTPLPIEPTHVAVLDPTQTLGQLADGASYQEMEVRGHQGVRMELDLPSANRPSHVGKEAPDVRSPLEHRPACNPTVHDVVPGVRAVSSRRASHVCPRPTGPPTGSGRSVETVSDTGFARVAQSAGWSPSATDVGAPVSPRSR